MQFTHYRERCEFAQDRFAVNIVQCVLVTFSAWNLIVSECSYKLYQEHNSTTRQLINGYHQLFVELNS